jgi:hypothetical protein
MKTLPAIILCAALAGGCSDDVDISGLYQTSYHTQNTGDCATEGPAITDDPPYFLIELSNFLGQEFYTFSECSSASETDCTGFGIFGQSFTEPIDGGWRGEMSLASYSGDQCYLTFAHGQAILADDGTLRIEWRSYSEQATLSDDDCTAEEAGDRGDDMPCELFDVLVGQPVGS